jgi:hypothetical protein
MGKYQFLHLPFSVFNNDNDKKLLDKILRDKGYLKS